MLRAASLHAPNRPAQSVIEIGAIVEALERRDPDAAAEAAMFQVRQAARMAFTQIGEERSSLGGGGVV